VGTTRSGWSWALLGLVALALARPALAADEAALEGLRQLFATDPVAGFEKAQELFEEPRAKGDLDGAMSLFRVVRGWVGGGWQRWAVADDMAAPTEALARARGDFGAVAELLATRVHCAAMVPGGLSYPYWGAGQHFIRVFQAQAEARQKAGLAPTTSPYQALYDSRVALADADPAAHWVEYYRVDTGLLETIRTIERATADERYDDALTGVKRLMSDVERNFGAATNTSAEADYVQLTGYIGQHISMPGGEAIVAPFRALVDRHGDLNCGGMTLESAMEACVWRWTGRDDVYRDTFYWCLGHFRQERHQPPVASVALFCQRLASFGRGGEAQDLLRRLLAMTTPERRRPDLPAWDAHRLVWPGMPDALLGEVFALVRREAWLLLQSPPAWYRAPPEEVAALIGEQVREVVVAASAERHPHWARQGADALQDLALALPDADARAAGLLAAADLYVTAGCPDLAAECRELARAIAAGDPKALLQCALTSAQSQAVEGKWDEAAKGLEAALTGAPDSPELVPAGLLLAEAHLRLGHLAEGQRWMARAEALVGTVPMPPGEKANYLVALAGLCDLAAQVAEGGRP
jgi:hypothetical protein